jgi:predicted GTPase
MQVDSTRYNWALPGAWVKCSARSCFYVHATRAGHVKAGKSSLINAFLRMKDSAEGSSSTGGPLWGLAMTRSVKGFNPHLSSLSAGAAKVGVSETTQEVHKYDYLCATLYDMPGAGTSSHPAATYYKDKHLAAFNAIILVSDTMTEADCQVIKDVSAVKIVVSIEGH